MSSDPIADDCRIREIAIKAVIDKRDVALNPFDVCPLLAVSPVRGEAVFHL